MTASSPLVAQADRTTLQTEAARLAGLRTELDTIDDALHDLLMRRAGVVARVAARKSEGGAAGRLRPGREAAIIRRLLARHDGRLPPTAILRIWRELLAGSVAMQGSFAVAVSGDDLTAVAREQFGALTPLIARTAPSAVVDAVAGGRAAVGIVPWPRAGAPDAWWPALPAALHVVARLPFWAPRPDGAPQAEALAIAASPPDPSGDDRTLLAFRTPDKWSDATLHASLAATGWALHTVIQHHDAGGLRALIEVAGFVDPGDQLLASLAAAVGPVRVLGAYACPIASEG